MLIDFVTSKSNKTINDINIMKPGEPPPAIPLAQCLKQITTICNTNKREVLPDGDLALLQVTKDALIAKCDPSSPQSIAYSTLYLSKLKGRLRTGYAAEAFPLFDKIARDHRIINYVMMAVALFLAGVALYKSIEATNGKFLIDARQELRIQQTAIRAEQLKVDAKDNNHTEWRQPPLLQASMATNAPKQPLNLNFDLCQRAQVLASILAPQTPYLSPTSVLPIPIGFQWPTETAPQPQNPGYYTKKEPKSYADGDFQKFEKLVPIYESPLQANVCNRDLELAAKFQASSIAIHNYINEWQSILSSMPRSASVGQGSCNTPAQSCGNGQTGYSPSTADLEFKIAPNLLVISNIILPTVFAFLGAAAFVIINLYRKLQNSTLTPDERVLGAIRLVLGGIIGICISLFFSSGAPVATSATVGAPPDILGSMQLTTSFIAFLAGFGVDGVFNSLCGLVNRLFPSTPAT